MTHLAFVDRREPVALEADYVVVGSGPGGAAAAVELARGGARVALVEAGAWRRVEDYPSTVYGSLRDVLDGWGTNIVRGRAMWPVVQARCVGGGTVINSAIVVRTPADVFARWEREHGVGGLAERVWAEQDRLDVELAVEECPERSLGRSNALARQGAAALGIEGHLTRRNVRACTGSCQCMQGCRDGRKRSCDVTWVPELLERGGVVLSCAPAERVLIEGGRAVGVAGRFQHPATRARGAPFAVRARRGVLVGASVTGTPVLLARSGVRHPALGEQLRSHPGTGIFGVYPEPVDQNVGATQGWASVHFRDDPGFKLETLSIPPDLVASRLMGGGSTLSRRLASYRHLAMWCMAVRADTVGSVKPAWGPLPAVRYTMIESDMRKMRTAAHFLARMHVAAGARAVIPGVHGLPYELGPGEIDRILDASLDPRRWVAILSHLFGGAVMGADPARAVCDGRGRVRGVDRLAVVDASVIPTHLGVNPQHTIMGLAAVFARDLLAEA